MRHVRTAPLIGLLAQLAVLAILAGTAGLAACGWLVGGACALGTCCALDYGLLRSGATTLGPANRVTLVRATLVVGIAGLVADAFVRPVPVPALVALSVVALVFDAIDGWVARRTGTASALGARFDMEVDALLLLVLSVYVARSTGAWVLAIGTARYALAAASGLLPWLRAQMPARYWAKIVAAIQGVVLTVAVAGVVSGGWLVILLVASLALLAESFGRQVNWLWRHRPVHPVRIVEPSRQLVLAGHR